LFEILSRHLQKEGLRKTIKESFKVPVKIRNRHISNVTYKPRPLLYHKTNVLGQKITMSLNEGDRSKNKS
jgi:hypothetical protein